MYQTKKKTKKIEGLGGEIINSGAIFGAIDINLVVGEDERTTFGLFFVLVIRVYERQNVTPWARVPSAPACEWGNKSSIASEEEEEEKGTESVGSRSGSPSILDKNGKNLGVINRTHRSETGVKMLGDECVGLTLGI
ncbi:hypothetical protein U1Q18_025174, partial [Sarracenia purpurea var. burkii]